MKSHDLLFENGKNTVHDESYVRQVTGKWGKLVEGINDKHRRATTAVLCENQMTHLRALNEETRMASAGPFNKYIFPVLRRVFPNLIANEIMSVQPMTAPIGAVFYFEYVFSSNKGDVEKGEYFVEKFSEFYSSEFIADESVAVGDGAKTAFTFILDWTPIYPADEVTGRKVIITDGVEEFEDNGSGVLTGSGGGTGSINYTTGQVTLNFNAAPADEDTITASYYYNSESNSQVPEGELVLNMSEVRAESRKLKTQWSAEAADDLRAFHGIEAEAEMVAGISNEIALEIDREMIGMLVSHAKTNTSWAYTATSATRYQGEMDSIRNLLTTLGGLSAKIHRESKRAPANFIVTTPAVVNLLEQLQTHGDYRPAFQGNNAFGPLDPQQPSSYGPLTSNYGVMRVGTLMGKYAVYQDPFMSAGQSTQKLLLGLKGRNFMDAGAVYAPYVPLQVTPTFLDPDNFQFKKGMRTRYAKKMLRPEYYATLDITGLPVV